MRALVDTGAPISLFDLGAAEALGIRLRRAGAEMGSTRILGGDWQIQYEHVDLCLAGHPEVSWVARIAFVLDSGYQPPFQGILGTEGFLDRFAVTFNQYYDYFVVESSSDYDDRVGRNLVRDPVVGADHHWRHGRAR